MHGSLSLSLSISLSPYIRELYTHTHIYIYSERERKREVYIYTHTHVRAHTQKTRTPHTHTHIYIYIYIYIYTKSFYPCQDMKQIQSLSRLKFFELTLFLLLDWFLNQGQKIPVCPIIYPKLCKTKVSISTRAIDSISSEDNCHAKCASFWPTYWIYVNVYGDNCSSSVDSTSKQQRKERVNISSRENERSSLILSFIRTLSCFCRNNNLS